MRSLIILEVEHGEDTDRFNHMIGHILHEYDEEMARAYPGRPVVKDYTVRVDLPACCVLDSGENPDEPETDDGLTCDTCFGKDGAHYPDCPFVLG